MMNRKQFIKAGVAGMGALTLPKVVRSQPMSQDANFRLEEIKEFVFAAHKSFDFENAF